MQAIQQWLDSGRPYVVGVSLYMRYGHNANLKRLLTTEQQSPFKTEQLHKALLDLVKQEHKTSAAPSAPTPSKVILTWTQPADSNKVELALWHKARLLLKEIGVLHSSLTIITQIEARRDAALLLLDKDDELNDVYTQRDYYRLHGHLPEESNEAGYFSNPFDIARRMQTVKRAIRKFKARVAKNANDVVAAGKLQQLTNEHNYYAHLLKVPLL